MSPGSQLALAPQPVERRLTVPIWSPETHLARRGPHDRAELEQATRKARTALAEAAIAAAMAAQRAISMAEVLDEALAVLEQAEGATATMAPAHEPVISVAALSPREREVLALVAEGRTNKAIADALFVSPNTVKTHVASLLHKLNAASRVQLAAIAARGA